MKSLTLKAFFDSSFVVVVIMLVFLLSKLKAFMGRRKMCDGTRNHHITNHISLLVIFTISKHE